MNNSYRLGKSMPFNAKSGRFGDNKDAYEHFMSLHSVMSDGVKVPEDGSNYVIGPWLTFNADKEIHTGAHAVEANALLKDNNRPGFQVPHVRNV
ncbi:gfo/Idh/MocA family oxidoreductase, partial [bacterium]|nr:gfo/Idh/MocA family oxidoreductase [bacterium]